MKSAGPVPYSSSERRAVLQEARSVGQIPFDRLDRLLADSFSSNQKLSALHRSLHDVQMAEAENEGDFMNEALASLSLRQGAGDGDQFRFWSKQARSLTRLTRSEEVLLARRLEFSRGRVDRAQKGADAAGWSSGCQEYDRLRSYFVERNLSFVVTMCAPYRTYGVPMMDLIQEGNAAVIRAVEKFDWRREVRFSTYAAFWVRQAVERLITANRGIVRVPNYMQQKLRRFRREGKLSRDPRQVDISSVSRLLGVSPKAAARVMASDRTTFSLDGPQGDDDTSYGSQVSAEDHEPEQLVDEEQALLEERLEQVMAETLNNQERAIIERRFGLFGKTPQTLEQVGQYMKVSRERIRQLQVRALSKLGRPSLLRALADFI